MTETDRCVFTVKESGAGTPFLAAEPCEGMALLKIGDLTFHLREGATYEEAQEIASYLNDSIESLAYTISPVRGEMHGKFVVRENEEGMVGLAVKSRDGDEEPAIA